MNNNSPELFQGTNFHVKSSIDTLDEDEAFERDISLNTDDACSSHNHLTDNGSQSNGSCLERYSGQCSLSSEFESYSTSTDIELRDFNNVKKEDATRSQSPSKLEKIADIIINAVIVKGQQRLIDQDNHEDNITYEKSDKRLIICGLGLAGLCSLSSLICIISVFQAFEVRSQKVFLDVPIVERANFPIPHVAFMNRLKGGSMLVFKQMNKSHFDFAWKFNIPIQMKHQFFDFLHTYFMFEDLSKIHVAYSNMKLKMTVIPTSTLKHFTIPKSRLKQEFVDGFSVRMGNFVMIFGGENGYGNPDYPDGSDIVSAHQCSSVNDNKNKVTTQIWSIKRQVWIKGPYLPLKTGCVDYACGVSINRTHGILFYQPPFMQPCIDAITFSLDTFKWVDIKKCIIFPGTTFILKLTCSSYLNKNGNMQVVMLLQIQYHYSIKIHDTKIYIVNYPGLNHQVISVQEDLKATGFTLFTLRSNIYLASFQQSTVTFHTLDIMSNKSLVSLQELQHPLISNFISLPEFSLFDEALPFYS